ncbi:hypothetical protein [Labrys wisconsinensis]|uniref:Uncharacterized protein n=1 Tax=Labrys wisconsinensis TaxID=425677 RepID=A0ABU0JHE0_9HYPH|nr:hypothetical protein [Labrys wisconsinensis]MDQ0473706.1 hypothetical protein [Labrys wisconsinensis]
MVARLAALMLAVLAATPAGAASLLEKNFWLSGPNYDGDLPACHDPGVADKIVSRFATKESEYWHSSLTIQLFDRQREIAYRPWGASYIPRRFCTARVMTSDGRYRRVSYAIGEDLGIIGATWGVEWCVAGLDRNLAYAPACKMAQP